MRVNRPIRVVEIEEDIYRVFIIKESKELEVNEEVKKFIDKLLNWNDFDNKTISEYLNSKKLYRNKEEYVNLLKFFYKEGLLIK